jgi:hypothetical protein
MKIKKEVIKQFKNFARQQPIWWLKDFDSYSMGTFLACEDIVDYEMGWVCGLCRIAQKIAKEKREYNYKYYQERKHKNTLPLINY